MLRGLSARSNSIREHWKIAFREELEARNATIEVLPEISVWLQPVAAAQRDVDGLEEFEYFFF